LRYDYTKYLKISILLRPPDVLTGNSASCRLQFLSVSISRYLPDLPEARQAAPISGTD